jgi:hypothetical protein
VRAQLGCAAVAAIAVALAGASPGAAGHRSRTSTLDWIRFSLTRIAQHRLDVPRENRASALAAVAIYDAVARVPPPSAQYAAAGAATVVLDYLFPAQRQALANVALTYKRANARAYSAGTRVGRAAVAHARRDGSTARWRGHRPIGAQYWVPTEPDGLPVEPRAGRWRPWNLRSGSQFRPSPPPLPGSPDFAREENLVYSISQHLTPAARRLARSWTRSRWPKITLALVQGEHLSERQQARVYAAVLVAQYDATIACWDAKYAYWSIRPVTAIRRDLNPQWTPLLETPMWPSYVSAHATISAAGATVLTHFFPSHADFLREQARLAAESRVFAGVHFPIDNNVGLDLGRRVGRLELARLGRLPRLL